MILCIHGYRNIKAETRGKGVNLIHNEEVGDG